MAQTLEKHHKDLVVGLSEQLRPIFESSEQAMYLYLDDTHKTCNQKFASLLGYSTPEEWANTIGPFLFLFVDKGSQEALLFAYRDAIERKVASTTSVVWRRKDGGTVQTTVTVVPVSYDGHLFALHFIAV